MEQTALRPKPMPGREPGGSTPSGGPAPRPRAARRRGRRLRTLLFGGFAGTLLVLSGVGLGTVGATVIGMSRLAELQRQAAQHSRAVPGAPSARSASAPVPASGSTHPVKPASPASPSMTATLGVEAVDDSRPGALVVGVHLPGPGYTAGLVRGDVVLALGRTRIESAADLAHAVAGARPGANVVLTVRHRSGGYQQLTATLGVVV